MFRPQRCRARSETVILFALVALGCLGSSVLPAQTFELSQMLTDFERPYIYALDPGSTSSDPASLLFINTNTEQVEKVIPIGSNPTDMTIHYGEGRLYVTDWLHSLTHVVDLSTQEELAPLALGPDVFKINAGKPERIKSAQAVKKEPVLA